MTEALRQFAARSSLHGLLVVILLMAIGASLSSFIGLALTQLLLGIPLLTDPSLVDQLHTDPENVSALRLMQAVQSLGMLIAPSALFLYVQGPSNLTLFRWPVRQPVTICVVLFMVLLPFVNYVAELNGRLVLPGELGAWVREKEGHLQALTARFLDMPDALTLMINLVVMALLPALGEELLFRGVFQRLMQRSGVSAHLSVWLAAALFSAIHMQFLGFVPRLLMGAVLGYLLLWSGNLWYPIIAHFANNAAAIILSFAQQRDLLTVDVDTLGVQSPMQAALSLGMGLMLLFLFHTWMQRGSSVGEQ